MFKRLFAEFFGTFWLVLGGCGSAVLAAAFPNLGIGFAGVALSFVNYKDELPYFLETVLPLLRDAGLRG